MDANHEADLGHAVLADMVIHLLRNAVKLGGKLSSCNAFLHTCWERGIGGIGGLVMLLKTRCWGDGGSAVTNFDPCALTSSKPFESSAGVMGGSRAGSVEEVWELPTTPWAAMEGGWTELD